MNWGARIVLSFIVFGIIIISMVVIAMKQDINLVSEDYYKQEIEYQEQIERLKNTEALAMQPEISLGQDNSSLELFFPSELRTSSVTGSLLFFRPSDAKMDQEVDLQLNEEGRQTIQIKYPRKGYWKAQLSWKQNEKEYFKEQVIIL